MNAKNAPFLIIVIIGIAGFMFWLYAPTFKNGIKATTLGAELPAEAAGQLPPPPPPPPPPPGMSEVIASDTYADGAHKITGTVTKSNACDTLVTAVTVDKSTPQKVEVTLKTNKATGTCTKTDATEAFSLPFKASEDAQIHLTLNGSPFTLTPKQAE